MPRVLAVGKPAFKAGPQLPVVEVVEVKPARKLAVGRPATVHVDVKKRPMIGKPASIIVKKTKPMVGRPRKTPAVTVADVKATLPVVEVIAPSKRVVVGRPARPRAKPVARKPVKGRASTVKQPTRRPVVGRPRKVKEVVVVKKAAASVPSVVAATASAVSSADDDSSAAEDTAAADLADALAARRARIAAGDASDESESVAGIDDDVDMGGSSILVTSAMPSAAASEGTGATGMAMAAMGGGIDAATAPMMGGLPLADFGPPPVPPRDDFSD